MSTAKTTPAMAAWRRTIPVQTPIINIRVVLNVGSFVVGAEGDPQISGHPDIRY